MPRRLFLIDGHSYIFRAFYAVPHLSNAKGFPTNALYGFVNMLMKVIREQKPDLLAMVFDPHGPTFRDEIYPEYKATRSEAPEALKQQIPRIKDLVQAFNIPILEVPGFEADDVIATYARRAEKAAIDCVIVTGDKDLMQLVTPHITLLDTMKDAVIDEEAVRLRFGVAPSQVADVLAIAGDTSDNIPGVDGIGDKGAAALVQQFGSVEELLARLPEVKAARARSALEKGADSARLSKRLTVVRTDVPLDIPLDDLLPRPYDEPRLRELLTEFNFGALLKTLVGAVASPASAPARYEIVSDRAGLGNLVQHLRTAGSFALHLERAPSDPMRARIIGIAFAFEPRHAAYLPLNHHYMGAPVQMELSEALDLLRPVLEDPRLSKIVAEAKATGAVLAHAGVTLRGLSDEPLVAAYLLHPGQREPTLDGVLREFLAEEITPPPAASSGRKQIVPLEEIDVDTASRLAGERANASLRLAPPLRQGLDEAALQSVYADLEIPLIDVLRRMEMTGIRIDLPFLASLSRELGTACDERRVKIASLAGGEFNVESPKQLQDVLFERLKLPRGRKIKTGYSTDVDVLESLAKHHPLPAAILEFRSLVKLKNTYVDSLPPLVHPRTGRVHTSFHQTVAATGRLSSSDPNLQNIPIRTPEGRKIRRAFIPTDGWILVSADYSQIELRVLAHLSGDPDLIEAFRSGEDVHTRTAAALFDVIPGLVDDEMRRRAKTINFGVIYGMSAHGLAGQLGIPHPEAQRFIDQYFARHAGVRRYFDALLAEARKTGRVSTLLGRRRPVPDLDHPNPNLRGAAERIALNTPIQGTAADLIKKAMLRVDAALAGSDLRARMLLQVHDELVFEAPPEEMPRLLPLIRGAMEQAFDLKVPLVVDCSSGPNWADMEEIADSAQ